MDHEIVRRRRNNGAPTRRLGPAGVGRPAPHLGGGVRDLIARIRPARRRIRPATTRAIRSRALAAVVAVGAGLGTYLWWDGANDVRSSWGSVRTVLVASRPVEPGGPLDSSTVRAVVLPVAAVPAQPLDRLRSGQRAVRRVGLGVILVVDDVTPGAVGPLAARLPPGHTGVSVTIGEHAPAIAPGDRVDVVVGDDATSPGGPVSVDDDGPPRGASGSLAADDALVLDVRGEAVTLAVADESAPGLAERALLGPVGITVQRPGGPLGDTP